MAVVALDREAARAAISAAAGRFTALVRDTDRIERPAAGTNWTVAETAAHVSCGNCHVNLCWRPGRIGG